jgi:mono/diheme cytochrome c family protein
VSFLRRPFGQAVVILVVAYVLIDFGIPLMPHSAIVPNTVVLEYMAIVLVGLLLWVSDNEERWTEFKRPIHRTLVAPERKLLRGALLVAIPLLVAFVTWNRVKPSLAAPPSLRSIHPAPPGTISFQGKQMNLTGLENPLRVDASQLEHHVEEGKRIYYQNCLACHGDFLDGLGHYAHGFNPQPANFEDVGTIAQLTESFVFWRIAKGGPGLPNEGTPWNSAMPAWEDFLTEEEIWQVIIFLYAQAEKTPRTWEVGEGAEPGAGGGQ